MTTYRTRKPRRRRPAHRDLLGDIIAWIAALLLVAAIVLMLSSPLLQPL